MDVFDTEEDPADHTSDHESKQHGQNRHSPYVATLGGFQTLSWLIHSTKKDNIALAATLISLQAQQSIIWR